MFVVYLSDRNLVLCVLSQAMGEKAVFTIHIVSLDSKCFILRKRLIIITGFIQFKNRLKIPEEFWETTCMFCPSRTAVGGEICIRLNRKADSCITQTVKEAGKSQDLQLAS